MRSRPFPLISIAAAALILACSDGGVGPPALRDADIHLRPRNDSLPPDSTKKPKKPKKPKPAPCDTLTDTTCMPPCDSLSCPPPCDTLTCPPPPCDTLGCPPPPCDTLTCPPPPCDTLTDTLCTPDSLRVARRANAYTDVMSRPGLRGLFEAAPTGVRSRGR